VNEIKKNKTDPFNPTRFKLLFIDHNFIPLYGLKLKAGRNYLPGNKDEENNGRIILNESAIYALGFNSIEEAIGKEVSFPLWSWMKPKSEIIGIVEDYHHESIKRPVMPMIFFLNLRGFQQVHFSVRVNAGSNPAEALSYIESTWKKVFPERPFRYFFLDDYYDQQFKSELHFGRVFGLFAGVAVFLACLGVLGITLFEANARLKEVGIRKVLGASVKNILALLSKEHFRVAMISSVAACPLIYLLASQWLTNYPVRINVTAIIFALPIAVVVLLIVVTSSFLTWKVATSNPVDHLKHE
jgi:putative ABC transport system permease protein